VTIRAFPLEASNVTFARPIPLPGMSSKLENLIGLLAIGILNVVFWPYAICWLFGFHRKARWWLFVALFVWACFTVYLIISTGGL
jgi:hypothetical protein